MKTTNVISVKHDKFQGSHFTVFTSIRRTWGDLKPATRVKPSAKLFKRRERIASDLSE